MTVPPSDAHTAYERAQKEIDKVLGPRDSKSPPDVIAASDRKRYGRPDQLELQLSILYSVLYGFP